VNLITVMIQSLTGTNPTIIWAHCSYYHVLSIASSSVPESTNSYPEFLRQWLIRN